MSYQGRDYQVKKSNKVYISNLNYGTTEEDLRKAFDKFGPISSVNLKQKDDFTFAFVEFDTVAQAESAIAEYDGKTLNGNEVKVKFARGGNDRRGGFNDRGRGGYGGDRGGFQSRGGYDGPRRDFGDRPRGCFNCGEEGHMIKDCPKPKKPREFNNNREGGFERRPYGGDREGGDRPAYGGRSYGGDRGGDYNRGGDRGGYQGRGSYGDRKGYGQDRSYGDRKYQKRRSSGSKSRSRSPEHKGNRRAARSPSSSRSR